MDSNQKSPEIQPAPHPMRPKCSTSASDTRWMRSTVRPPAPKVKAAASSALIFLGHSQCSFGALGMGFIMFLWWVWWVERRWVLMMVAFRSWINLKSVKILVKIKTDQALDLWIGWEKIGQEISRCDCKNLMLSSIFGVIFWGHLLSQIHLEPFGGSKFLRQITEPQPGQLTLWLCQNSYWKLP